MGEQNKCFHNDIHVCQVFMGETSLTEECYFYGKFSRMKGMKMIKKDLLFMSILPE